MKLKELKTGDVFRTKRKYSLSCTAKKCNCFSVIRHYTTKSGKAMTKTLALNYKCPDIKYFGQNMDIEKI